MDVLEQIDKFEQERYSEYVAYCKRNKIKIQSFEIFRILMRVDKKIHAIYHSNYDICSLSTLTNDEYLKVIDILLPQLPDDTQSKLIKNLGIDKNSNPNNNNDIESIFSM